MKENPYCCAFLRDMIMSTLLRDRKRIKSTAPRGIKSMTSRVLIYRCATTATYRNINFANSVTGLETIDVNLLIEAEYWIPSSTRESGLAFASNCSSWRRSAAWCPSSWASLPSAWSSACATAAAADSVDAATKTQTRVTTTEMMRACSLCYNL